MEQQTQKFVATVKYEKLTEQGLLKKVSEQYLFDAFSYLEVEHGCASLLKELAGNHEAEVVRITKSNIQDVLIDNMEAVSFYKTKVAYGTYNEKNGNIIITKQTILCSAKDIKDALSKAEQHSCGYNEPLGVESITLTPIKGYYALK